jgi:hypothetical protein
VSRRRVRSAAYRARRQARHAGRHYFIDEPAPDRGEPEAYLRGARVTEYRRGRIVSADIEPGDDHQERCAERADLDRQAFNQELRDAGRGHLVTP